MTNGPNGRNGSNGLNRPKDPFYDVLIYFTALIITRTSTMFAKTVMKLAIKLYNTSLNRM